MRIFQDINYGEYKEELLLNKYHFKSDTDSEVILNLLEFLL